MVTLHLVCERLEPCKGHSSSPVAHASVTGCLISVKGDATAMWMEEYAKNVFWSSASLFRSLRALVLAMPYESISALAECHPDISQSTSDRRLMYHRLAAGKQDRLFLEDWKWMGINPSSLAETGEYHQEMIYTNGWS